eukprot:47768-Eustigmatos_ZCMA.PRE.1
MAMEPGDALSVSAPAHLQEWVVMRTYAYIHPKEQESALERTCESSSVGVDVPGRSCMSTWGWVGACRARACVCVYPCGGGGGMCIGKNGGQIVVVVAVVDGDDHHHHHQSDDNYGDNHDVEDDDVDHVNADYRPAD